MKKTILVSLIFIMVCLVGCSGNGNTTSEGASAVGVYKDGTYTVEGNEFDSNGYKSTVSVTVKDGAVYSIDCDAVNKDGQKKKAVSESGNYKMKEYGKAQAEWHEEIALFEKYAVNSGVSGIAVDSNGKTDTVAGCTVSVGDYVDLIEKALEKAQE